MFFDNKKNSPLAFILFTVLTYLIVFLAIGATLVDLTPLLRFFGLM